MNSTVNVFMRNLIIEATGALSYIIARRIERRSRWGKSVKIRVQRARLWLSPEGIWFVENSSTYWNSKYQITRSKQIPMTEIRNNKQKKDERPTSNAQHRTSNMDIASLHFLINETPRACHNRSSMFVFCPGFGHWILEFEIYLRFGAWNLRF